jgi:hypothetical protein
MHMIIALQEQDVSILRSAEALTLVSYFSGGLISGGVFWLAILSLPFLDPRFSWFDYRLSALLLPLSLCPLVLVFWKSRNKKPFLAGGLIGAMATIVLYVFAATLHSAFTPS